MVAGGGGGFDVETFEKERRDPIRDVVYALLLHSLNGKEVRWGEVR